MKNTVVVNGRSVELKDFYVLLERVNVEDINFHRPNQESRDESFETATNGDERQEHNILLLSHMLNEPEKLFRSYVLLERLSPQYIQQLLNKNN